MVFCGWEVEQCEDCCSTSLEQLPPSVVEALGGQAARFLWSATGKQYGLCERVLRPCRSDCGSFWGGLPAPVRLGGEWVNLTCGTCTGGCGCTTISEFVAADVHEVVSVVVDGEDLDPFDTVKVYDRRRVVRVDGGVWPMCQDLNVDEGAGAWSVTVMQGKPVPDGGGFMAGLLLCELAKACLGDSSCRLPKRVQTITREGVTVGFQDRFELLGSMLTGLWEIDSWIESNRYTGNTQPTVTSPDRPRPSVLTWPTEYPST